MDIHADLELKMKISHRELRVLLLHEVRLGHKTTEATSNIYHTMGKNALSIRTAQRCLNRFQNDNFKFDDLPYTGRPLKVDMDLLREPTKEDPRLTNYTVFSRVSWVLSYYSGNPYKRIRQNVEIWSLDTT